MNPFFYCLAAGAFVAFCVLLCSVALLLRKNPGKKISELEAPLLLRLKFAGVAALLLTASGIAAILTR